MGVGVCNPYNTQLHTHITLSQIECDIIKRNTRHFSFWSDDFRIVLKKFYWQWDITDGYFVNAYLKIRIDQNKKLFNIS